MGCHFLLHTNISRKEILLHIWIILHSLMKKLHTGYPLNFTIVLTKSSGDKETELGLKRSCAQSHTARKLCVCVCRGGRE